MPCCGKSGPSYMGTANQLTSDAPTAPVRPEATLVFEYVGHTGLTVFGPVTGRRYRFDAPGVRVAVAASDRAGLARVAVLRQRG
jgi:hypothetical protein